MDGEVAYASRLIQEAEWCTPTLKAAAATRRTSCYAEATVTEAKMMISIYVQDRSTPRTLSRFANISSNSACG